MDDQNKNRTPAELVTCLAYSLRGAIPLMVFIAAYLAGFVWIENRPVSDPFLLHAPLDDRIPFVAAFSLPYVSWVIYMLFSVMSMYWFDRGIYRKVFWSLVFGMTLFIAVSVVFPNYHDLRPDLSAGGNWFDRICTIIYGTDTPSNLMPSIHVYDTAVVIWYGLFCRRGLYRFGIFRFFLTLNGILILLSTMFVKQHSVYDVAAGLLLLIVPIVFFHLEEKRRNA